MMFRTLRSRRFAALLMVAAVCALSAAPTALARPAIDAPPHAALPMGHVQSTPPRTVIQRVPESGFDAGDAAIGAAIAAAIMLAALGVLASGRHPRVRFTH
jgi:hypothetical protein